MILDDIKSIERSINFKNSTSDNSDFEALWKISISDEYTIEERKHHLSQLAHLFWAICTSYKGTVSDFKDVKKISQFIDYINQNKEYYNPEVYTSKEIVFISFLHDLLHKDESMNDSTSDFKDFYYKIVDFLEKLKWLFGLKNDDGKLLFPIRKIIEDVANTFKCDQEHYLQLVFSLEIFNKIDVEEDSNVIKSKMLKIAKEYNIELIRLLCNGGSVLYGKNAGINSSSNGTIVVQAGTTILIRNESESYIDENYAIEKYNGRKSYEGKDSNDPIAYYYIYDISGGEKLESFKNILKEYPPACRLDAISYIFKHKNYNVFLGDCFWVDVNNRSFSRILNPFSNKDENIILDGKAQNGSDAFDKFINVMKNKYDEYGVISLCERNDMDVLTLDFVISFYDELVKDGNNFIDRMINEINFNKDFLQNILFKIYIENSLNDGKIAEALSKYSGFIKKHYPYDSVDQTTQFSEYNKLIMPFSPYVPFNGNPFDFYQAIKDTNFRCNVEICKIVSEKRRLFTDISLFDLNDKAIKISPDVKIMDINDVEIEKNGIRKGYCLYDKSNGSVYIYDKERENETIIERLCKYSEKAVVKQGINFPEFKKIHTVCQNIGFSDHNSNFNRKITECVKEANKNIGFYKLLWHIQASELTTGPDNRYELFRKLVLECYYTEFVLNYQEYIDQYYGKLEEDSSQSKLIIAKESSGEVSTLYNLYIKNRNIDRGTLPKAFDGAQIDSDFIISDNTYLGIKVDEIIFITDNILSGGSTVKMLKFYLENISYPGDKRTYLWKKSEIVPSILKENPEVKIVVKTIFSTPKGEEKIKEAFPKLNINFERILSVPEDKYNFDENVKSIVEKLYGPFDRKRHSSKCIFRPCNMPADAVLPDFVKDVSKLIGIFQRKGEV